jgi:hypothetical protein
VILKHFRFYGPRRCGPRRDRECKLLLRIRGTVVSLPGDRGGLTMFARIGVMRLQTATWPRPSLRLVSSSPSVVV